MFDFSLQSAHLAAKVLQIMTSLFCIVIFAAFEADVTTKMTVSLAAEPLRSYEDIYLSDYDVTVQSGTSLYDMMQDSDQKHILNRLFTKIQAPKRVDWFEGDCEYACLENALKVHIPLATNRLHCADVPLTFAGKWQSHLYRQRTGGEDDERCHRFGSAGQTQGSPGSRVCQGLQTDGDIQLCHSGDDPGRTNGQVDCKVAEGEVPGSWEMGECAHLWVDFGLLESVLSLLCSYFWHHHEHVG